MEFSSKFSFYFIFFFLFAFIAYAQDSPEDYVDAHNAARSEVGVLDIVWDDTVAEYAQNYVRQRKIDCQMVHSGSNYGENLAWSSGDMSGVDAVKMWVDEKTNYDYNTNSCVGGECLHYTQVVWGSSIRLGCAKVRCDNGGTFVSCNYDPRGNIFGRRYSDSNYEENILCTFPSSEGQILRETFE
ncbi:hypothetical protein K1719_016550 [Acacia pycnantha]|nr:hypothetical protein K1719_016550 [Acacia pycnantha]